MGANSITLHCNLTRDPEQIGTTGCKMRVANNQREKVNGEWADRANYFDVVVFGGRADACLAHLVKGSEVVVLGRLRWSEYTAKDGNKRESVSIFASEVDFVGGKKTADDGGAFDAAKAFVGPGAAAAPGDEDIPW